MTITVIVAMKKSAMERVLMFESPSAIPIATLVNSAPHMTARHNVNVEIAVHRDSVIFVRDSCDNDSGASHWQTQASESGVEMV